VSVYKCGECGAEVEVVYPYEITHLFNERLRAATGQIVRSGAVVTRKGEEVHRCSSGDPL
jgi:hypothetical protein